MVTGPTPFGFDFDTRGHLVISDANAGVAGGSALSSYRVARDGSLTRLDAGVTATTGTGPTDLALSRDGRFVVNVNGGSDTLTVFAIGRDGALTLVTTVSGPPGPALGIAAS